MEVELVEVAEMERDGATTATPATDRADAVDKQRDYKRITERMERWIAWRLDVAVGRGGKHLRELARELRIDDLGPAAVILVADEQFRHLFS